MLEGKRKEEMRKKEGRAYADCPCHLSKAREEVTCRGGFEGEELLGA